MSRLTRDMVRSGWALLRRGQIGIFLGHLKFFLSSLFRVKSNKSKKKLIATVGRQTYKPSPPAIGMGSTKAAQVILSTLTFDPHSVSKSTPVAVVIPVFNDSKYLAQAINSALEQDHANTHVYVVDDGSTHDVFRDLPREILESSRVVLLRHDKNLGLPAARNTGLAASWEPLVQFLDADDLMAPWAVSRRVKMLSAAPAYSSNLVGTALGVLQASEGYSDTACSNLKDRPGPIQLLDYLSFDFQNPFNVHAPLVAREAIESTGFFDESLTNGAEDADFWGRMLLAGYGFIYDQSNMGVVYRQRTTGSMVHVAPLEHSDQVLKVMARWAKKAPSISKAKVSFAMAKRRVMSLGLAIAQRPERTAELMADFEPLEVPPTRISETLASFLSAVRRGLGFGPLEVNFSLGSKELKPLLETVSKNILTKLEAPETPAEISLGRLIGAREKSYVAHDGSHEVSGFDFDFHYLHKEEGPLHSTSRGQLLDLKDMYKGETCVLIGNGPSLNHSDPAEIAKFPAFGVNSIFLAAPPLADAVTFYTVEDTKVMEENVDAINSFSSPQIKFFPAEYESRIIQGTGSETVFFRMNGGYYGRSTPTRAIPRFSLDPTERLFCGQSVTFINLQLAYWMGFSRVALVGMDFEYRVPESSVVRGNHILSKGDDPNHFHPDYFGAGKTWKDPKLDQVAEAYRLAKQVFEDDGREILNCTEGGKLEIFPRLGIEKL